LGLIKVIERSSLRVMKNTELIKDQVAASIRKTADNFF